MRERLLKLSQNWEKAMSELDKAKLSIPCPGCGHKNEKSIAWIKAHDHFVCGGCGKDVEIDKANLVAGLEKSEKALADFKRTLGRLGKNR